MSLFNIQDVFSQLHQDIDKYRLPYPLDELNIKVKLIGIVCLSIIAICLASKYARFIIVAIFSKVQQLIQSRKNKQINDISEMFEEKVNIEAEPIDDLVNFLDKFKGKSQQQKYDQMNTLKFNPSSITEATYTYKPRNVQLLEKIKRETEEKEKLNDPYFANRFNRNGYNKMNDLSNYTQVNPYPFLPDQSGNNILHSQSMNIQQQQFITPNDGLQTFDHNRNGANLIPQPKFGMTSFNYGEQRQINRGQSIKFSAFGTDDSSQPQANIVQQQMDLYNKLNKDLKNNEQKEMDVEETNNNNTAIPQNIDNTQQAIQPSNQQNSTTNKTSQIINQNEAIELENEAKNKEHKRKNNPMKGVLKKKLINKTQDYKFRPTRSSISIQDEEKAQKTLKKKQINQVAIDEQYEDEDDDYDEEFIIYKKAKKLQAVPFKKQKMLSQRSQQDFVKQDRVQRQVQQKFKPINNLSSKSYSDRNEQPLELTRKQSNQNSINRQNRQLSQQQSQLDYPSQQRQTSNQVQIYQEQQQNQIQQQLNIFQQQQKDISPAFSLQQKNQSQQQEVITENQTELNNVAAGNLPPPKSVSLSKLPNQLQSDLQTNQNNSECSFFDPIKFQHQSIQITRKYDIDLYDQTNKKGFIARIVNNQNAFLMPNDNIENDADNQEEKKEDKSAENTNGETTEAN